MSRARVALVAIALLTGCAASERLLADRHDYALYRATRIAGDVETRLGASQRYLREEPQGRFRGEVMAWFKRAEPRFFRAAKDRPSLLRGYLRVLPDGPHAASVRARLEEFEILNAYRARREAASERFISRVQSELERAEAGRRALLAELTTLAHALAALRSFGQPPSQLSPELGEQLGLPGLASDCVDAPCTKEFQVSYAVPEGTKLAPREARYTLALTSKSGLVQGLTLSGPELFSRIGEAVDRRPIAASDISARAEAIARAVQVVENAIESELPLSECGREVLAPVVLERECRGVRFRMSAALDVGGDDQLQIEPLRP